MHKQIGRLLARLPIEIDSLMKSFAIGELSVCRQDDSEVNQKHKKCVKLDGCY